MKKLANVKRCSKLIRKHLFGNLLLLKHYTDLQNIKSHFLDQVKDYLLSHGFEEEPELNSVLNPELVDRLIYNESKGNSRAVSPANAKGLFQINPKSHKEYLQKTGNKGDLFDEKYSRTARDWLLNKYSKSATITNGNPTDSVYLAKLLGAYNYGPENLGKKLQIAKNNGIDIYKTLDWVNTKYIPKETVDYINFVGFGKSIPNTSNTDYEYYYWKNQRNGNKKAKPYILYLQDLKPKMYIKKMRKKRLIKKAKTGLLNNIQSFIRNRFYNTISPSLGYEIIGGIKNFINNNKRIVYNNDGDIEHDLLLATYLDIPIQRRNFKKQLQKSQYKPTIGVNSNDVYYKVDLSDKEKRDLINYANGLMERGIYNYEFNQNILKSDNGVVLYDGTPLKIGLSKQTGLLRSHNLGTSTISKGHDKNGEYISYFDSWDLNPFKGINGERNNNWLTKKIGLNKKDNLLDFLGNPVKFYDRIYLDDYYGVDEKDRGHAYLPEVIISNNPSSSDMLYKELEKYKNNMNK